MFDFVAIDFETANSNLYSACSVGLVAVKNGSIIRKDYFLIKPPTQHFNKTNIQIHGITYDMVKHSKNFAEIFPVILDYISSTRVLAAHNAHFDMSVLRECIDFFLLSCPDFVYIDTMNFPSPVKHDCGNSLKDCADFFGIDLTNHHNALCDAEVCAKIVIESIEKSDANNLAEYVLFYPEVTRKRFSELEVLHTISHKSNAHSSSHPYYLVNPASITTTNTSFDEDNPFFHKNCVFTGDLNSLTRQEAMQKIVDMGGILKSSVSSKTDYLIVGKQDKNLVGEAGVSSKQRKAYTLINKGVPIKILEESDFLKLITNRKEENDYDF